MHQEAGEVTGSPENPLVVAAAQAFAGFLGAEVTYAHIIGPGEQVNDVVKQRYIEPEDSSQRLPITVWEAQSPAAELVRRSEQFDLLVLGSARESAMQQLMFGSVTQTVAKQAKCSVLLVKKEPGRVRAIAREMFRPLGDGERTEIEVPEDE